MPIFIAGLLFFSAFSVPSPPTALQSKATSTSILLTWGPPFSLGGSHVTSYEVEYSRGGSSPRSHIRTSGTSINITGLQPVTNYTVQVYAESSVGRSNPATANVQTIMATSMCCSCKA